MRDDFFFAPSNSLFGPEGSPPVIFSGEDFGPSNVAPEREKSSREGAKSGKEEVDCWRGDNVLDAEEEEEEEGEVKEATTRTCIQRILVISIEAISTV